MSAITSSDIANAEPHPALVLDQCEGYWKRVREAYEHDEDFKAFLTLRNQYRHWEEKLHKAQAKVQSIGERMVIAHRKVKPELRRML